MGRPRKPINLVIADGKKHLTKTEIEERKENEVHANNDNIVAPDFLTDEQIAEFETLASELDNIGIMSNLDCDVLAQYIQSKDSYIYYGKAVQALRAKTMRLDSLLTSINALKEYEGLKDKAFKQCQSCASALGLTISSRCKLAVPKKEEKPKENKFAKFQKSGVG